MIFDYFAVVKTKRRDKQIMLKRFKTRLTRASTRNDFYKKLRESNSSSLYALCKRVSRAHMISKRFSLMCTISKEEEDALADV